MKELEYSWNGVDTNFVWRGPRGIRLNGGTSTGRAVRDQCGTELNAPNVKAREGNAPACNPYQRWDTNVRGTASYTIPWVDVLASTVFQWRPGVEKTATLTVTKEHGDMGAGQRLTRDAAVHGRAGWPGRVLYPRAATVTATNYQVNLLDPGDLYGEGYCILDLKLAKNIRFCGQTGERRRRCIQPVQQRRDTGRTRTHVPGDGDRGRLGHADGLLSPRFARLQVQFDF